MTGPRKIAVLGGGIGSLAAIFELTSLPNWRDRFDITVYQMGWQLGGKGASGRDARRFHRNEEHGLHVWLGFYDNAFDLVKRCYEELAPRHGHKFARWSDAFRAIDRFVLFDREFGPLAYPLPPNGERPGRRRPRPHVIWDHAVQLASMLAGAFERSNMIGIFRDRRRDAEIGYGPAGGKDGDGGMPGFGDAPGRLPRDRRGGPRIEVVVPRVAERFENLPKDPRLLREEDRDALLRDLEFVVKTFGSFSRADFDKDRAILAYWELLDIGFGILKGLVADNVIVEGFEVIEGLDWRSWLRARGVHGDALDSAPVRAAYDLVFGYVGGDPERGAVGAGTGTHCLLRMLLDYRGSVAYELRSGMGEAVFSPLYLVLGDRGVKFRFFHRIDQLRLSADRRAIDRIDFTRQARTRDGTPYRPLIEVKSLLCWPTAPLYSQLADGERLEADGFDSPAHDGIGEAGSLARGRDFDDVLLNIPLPALRTVAADLRDESPQWRSMLDNVAATATIAAQLWMMPDAGKLGFKDESTLLGGYSKPFDTVWDGDEVIRQEDFPAGGAPKSCMYLCGSFPEFGPDSRGNALEHARAMTEGWLQNRGPGLWNGVNRSPGFDWDCLYDPAGCQGADRLAWQHVSANVEPWQLYVQSLPGTAGFRLASDRSGFDNLYLSGDWTRTALNAGCMEAAVMSGIRAARGISGEHIPISGEDELTGGPPTPLQAIAARVARVDDVVGSVDAVGVVLALAREDARRILPRGLELMDVPGMPRDAHPLGVLFCRHWNVRPALAPSFLGARYEELAFALPFVRVQDDGADAPPSTVLPLLLLDDLLAAGGGFLLGFNKKVARLTVRGDSRLAASAFRGVPLLEFETRAAGAAGPPGAFPRFELATRIFRQPVLVRRPGGWRRSGMDFGLTDASIVPLTGKLHIRRQFLDGLGVASHDLPSIESSSFGAFGFSSEWYLDGGLLPTR